MGVSLRPAMEADLPAMIALDRDIFGAYGARESAEVICARVRVFPPGCVVLEGSGDQAQILGYLTTEKWAELRDPALDEDPHTTHQPDGRTLCITTLAVTPGQQGHGLGRRLLDHAIDLARRERCEQIVLETAHAVAFYQRHGFEQIGEREERGIRLGIMCLVL